MINRAGFFCQHVVPFFLAGTIVFIAGFFLDLKTRLLPAPFPKAAITLPADKVAFWDNYRDGYEAELNIRFALESKRTILVIGSSEMTHSSLEAIPYKFFPEQF